MTNSRPAAAADSTEEILAVHRTWWECNHTGDIPRMRTCFPVGNSYLMFNMNGHPYYGIEEKAALWKWYSTRLAISDCDIRIVQMHVDTDMAWIAAEGVFPVRATGEPGSGSATWPITSPRYVSSPVRTTEVYRRDDGSGRPIWKMWHFHGSQMASADETRPGFRDTGRQRGLGFRPV
jgi:hypothetical protein